MSHEITHDSCCYVVSKQTGYGCWARRVEAVGFREISPDRLRTTKSFLNNEVVVYEVLEPRS